MLRFFCRRLKGGIYMTPNTYKEIHLAKRPEGIPGDEDFAFIEKNIPSPGEGEVLVKTLYLSVDPYMRGRMRDVKSYVAPYKLNEAISGGILAEVVESNSDLLQKGDIVNGTMKWSEYNIVKAERVQKVDRKSVV